MTEATLPPETEKYLMDAFDVLKRSYHFDPDPKFWDTLKYELRAAATVAVEGMEPELAKYRAAIAEHRSQKADDRCWEDDQKLYAVLGDGDLGDNRVGDPEAMLANCKRFIANRCQGGEWKTYQQLEAELAALRNQLTTKEANLPGPVRQAIRETRGKAGNSVPMYEKTTPEEAEKVFDAWHIPDSREEGFKAMAAAIDKLIEKRLPTASGGMTIDTIMDDLVNRSGNLPDKYEPMVRKFMEQAVAEAVAAVKDHGSWYGDYLEAVENLNRERERHAAELARRQKAHNKEVDEFRAVINREMKIKSEEQANWQAERNKWHSYHVTKDQLTRAVAAAYEEAALITERYNQALIAYKIRERAAKPQETCGACGKEACTEVHADESDITHDFRPGAQVPAHGMFERNCAWWLV